MEFPTLGRSPGDRAWPPFPVLLRRGKVASAWNLHPAKGPR